MKSSRKNPSPNKKNTASSGKPYEAEKHLRLFCDSTSQELGTVLATIVGELDYALTTSNSTQKERSMMVAVSAAERALSLARNLRYFSVHTRLNVQVVDLSQVLLDTVELVEKELELAQIKIAVLAEASTCAAADSGAIQQVLLNLLAQARRSLPKGGKITLSLRQVGQQIEIRCQDTGPGLSEEELEHLFEPYAGTPEEVAGGRHPGLGLSVSKALVDAHGGDIQVQSRPGTGTTVTIHLPFDPKGAKPAPFAEERRFRRISLTLPVTIFFSRGQSALKTELTTLSVGGCFTRISDPNASHLPELNETVSIQIHYFGEEVLEVGRGRIASVCWAGMHSGVGVEFVELSDRAKKLLAAIVKSHST